MIIKYEDKKIETRQLVTFITVYQCGSFTKAAKILSTSQPTISDHVRSLEKRLECQLFDRLGRSIKTTRQAEILYPKALAIIDDIKKIEEELAQEEQSIKGELVLGASTIPGTYILPRIATHFKLQYPQISFEIIIADSGEIINSVLNHKLLIGIVGTQNITNSLEYYPFLEDDLILVAAAGRQIDSCISFDKLMTLPFLQREQGSGTRKTIEECALKSGLDINHLSTVAVFGSNASIKEAVKADFGVSILSRISISDELKHNQLKEIEIDGFTIKRSFYICTQKKRSLPNQYPAFIRMLQESS